MSGLIIFNAVSDIYSQPFPQKGVHYNGFTILNEISAKIEWIFGIIIKSKSKIDYLSSFPVSPTALNL